MKSSASCGDAGLQVLLVAGDMGNRQAGKVEQWLKKSMSFLTAKMRGNGITIKRREVGSYNLWFN